MFVICIRSLGEALWSDEATAKYLDDELSKWSQEQANWRDQNSVTRGINAQLLPAAMQAWRTSKKGNPMAYMRLLSDPTAMERVGALMRIPPEARGSMSQDDKDLLEAFEGFNAPDEQQALVNKGKVIEGFMKNLVTMNSKKEFNQMPQGQRASTIYMMNEQLKSLGAITGRRLRLEFKPNKLGFDGGDRIVVHDDDNQTETPLEKLDISTISDPRTPVEQYSAAVLDSTKNNLQAALEAVNKDKDIPPNMRTEVINRIRTMYVRRSTKGGSETKEEKKKKPVIPRDLK
jgi:hypothetical protein